MAIRDKLARVATADLWMRRSAVLAISASIVLMATLGT